MSQLKVEPKGIISDRVPGLRALWRPYMMFLRCLGIVNFHSDFSSNPWKDPWTFVCLACLLNTWAMLLIRLEIIKVTEASTKGELAKSLIRLIAVSAETISFTTLFVSSVCGNAFKNMFLMWSLLQLGPSSSQRLVSRMRIASLCVLVIFLILSITQITAYSILLYKENMLSGCTTVLQCSFYFRIASLFTSVHIVGFNTLVCVTLWLLFSEVNSVIDTGDITAFSAIFQHAADIVSAFDTVMAFIIGPYLVSYICQVVFNTYLAIKIQSDSVYWVIESVVMLLLVSLLPALVSVQAHRSYQVLCRMATVGMPVPSLLLVNGLQNRLSTTHIGLSAFHIRVMTINLIPSMISIYFTYIFLVIQFKTSDGQS